MKWILGLLFVNSLVTASTEMVPVNKSNCTVTVGFASVTPSSRCFSGEVMTGISSLNPLYVYCSRLSVQCLRTNVDTDDMSEESRRQKESAK